MANILRSVLSSILYQNDLSSVEIPDYDFLAALCVVIVMDDKGGLGKSLLAQIVAALLRSSCSSESEVIMIDSDGNNSSSYQVDPNARMLDLKNNKEAPFLQALRKVQEGSCRHIVVDIGAREERQMIAMLSWLLTVVGKQGGRVMVARPITLGSHNQRNARQFMNMADKLGIPTIFVQNHGQGRDPEYFYDWQNSQTYAEATELGAVHTEMPNFGVRHSDEAIGFGLSIADCAMGDFSKIEDDEERRLAANYFNNDVCIMLNERLRICMRTIGDAFQEAALKRDSIIQERLAKLSFSKAASDESSVSPDQPMPKGRKKS